MPLQTPPLRGIHDERGAKFTEFGGWDMPVEFDSIRTEHAAVREDAGSSTSRIWARFTSPARTRRR